ncbi:lipoprotein [Streptomyces brasiliensis]|uniref:Lipoprotein n=1 Tax=Streptomyces brasiliensis TaxID=1954 RepID=A0A917KCP8_9ACTN|nr:lipoprotein [Streptomyces brasiliensis]
MAALGTFLAALTACGGAGFDGGGAGAAGRPGHDRAGTAEPIRPGTVDDLRPGATDPTRIPGVGDRLKRRIPADSGQVVAVYGNGRDSADATLVLYTRHGNRWERTGRWRAHNGKKGWTTHHRSGDNRSPVGVFTLTDAGGVLADPGARLPYTRDLSFAAPRWWAASHWHDFDYVIAIDYNRVEGTPPNDPTRPEGEDKGGSIWLHMDHGSGTSGCVSLSKAAMEYLLRTLDPDRHPVVVMGDRAELEA